MSLNQNISLRGKLRSGAFISLNLFYVVPPWYSDNEDYSILMDGHLPITVLACVLSNSTLSDSWHSDKSTRCWRWNLCPQINPHRNTPGVIKKVRHLRSTSLPAVLSSPSLFLHHISSYMWLVIRNHVIRALRFNTHGFSSRVRWGSTLLHSNIFSRKFIFTAPSSVNWRTSCPWLESCYEFTVKQRRVFGGAGD